MRFKAVLPVWSVFCGILAALLAGMEGTGSAGPVSASRYDLKYVEEEKSTIAVVNGRRISENELEAARVFFPKGHGGGAEPRILDALIEQELIIQNAVREGATRDANHRRDVDLIFFTHLGMDYYENHLSRSTPFDAEEVSRLMPERWVKATVEYVLFPSIEEAKEAADKAKTRSDFEAIKKRFPGNVKTTTDLYPKSGFFQKFDDVAIFNRKDAGFYGALATGIGPAVLYVSKIGEPDDAEKEKMLERAKETVQQRQLGIEIDRIISGHTVEIHRKNITEYIKMFLRGDEIQDLPLAKIDDKVLGVVLYRMLTKREPLQYLKGLSEDDLVKEYEYSIRNACRAVIFGLEGQKNEFDQIRSTKYLTSFNNLKRRYYLYTGEKEGIGPIIISEELIRDYYTNNLDREFTLPDRVRAGHIFAKHNRKKLEKVRKLLQEGRSFNHLAMEMSEDGLSSVSGGDIGWLPRNRSLDPKVEKAVFGAKEGSITPIIKSAQGFHIFKVYEFQKARTIPLAEARRSIRDKLYRARFEQKRIEFVNKLKQEAKIEKRKAGLSK